MMIFFTVGILVIERKRSFLIVASLSLQFPLKRHSGSISLPEISFFFWASVTPKNHLAYLHLCSLGLFSLSLLFEFKDGDVK